ncbi:MAG TPA: ABC transporter permease [Candidatus Paceibacterota bacterium]|jgi:ABC-2 type transport system permease protein
MRSPALVGYTTIVRKDITRILRIWSQTLLPPIITTSLYFIIFGGFVGSQVAPIEGYSYMAFIVPGLIMMSMLTNAYQNTISTFFFAKWQRTIEELLVSSMPNWAIIAGYTSGGIVRAFMTGILVTIVALFFTELAFVNVAVIFGAAFLTALAFSLAGIINAVYAKGFDGISIVPTFVLTPLTYLGGVFYSIDVLPPFFAKLSLLNPILYMVNAFRYGFLGITDVPITTCFYVLGGFALVMFLWTAILFRRGAGLKR